MGLSDEISIIIKIVTVRYHYDRAWWRL